MFKSNGCLLAFLAAEILSIIHTPGLWYLKSFQK
jgi:hypothetical protein